MSNNYESPFSVPSLPHYSDKVLEFPLLNVSLRAVQLHQPNRLSSSLSSSSSLSISIYLVASPSLSKAQQVALSFYVKGVNHILVSLGTDICPFLK